MVRESARKGLSCLLAGTLVLSSVPGRAAGVRAARPLRGSSPRLGIDLSYKGSLAPLPPGLLNPIPFAQALPLIIPPVALPAKPGAQALGRNLSAVKGRLLPATEMPAEHLAVRQSGFYDGKIVKPEPEFAVETPAYFQPSGVTTQPPQLKIRPPIGGRIPDGFVRGGPEQLPPLSENGTSPGFWIALGLAALPLVSLFLGTPRGGSPHSLSLLNLAVLGASLMAVFAGMSIWNSLHEPIQPLDGLRDLGIEDPQVSKVVIAAGKLYENLRKHKPGGRFGGRKQVFTQRDLTGPWALTFKDSYLRLKAVTKPELAALIAFHEATEFSYGAGLDYDPFSAQGGDRDDYEAVLLKSLISLAKDLGLPQPQASAAGPAGSLEDLVSSQAGKSLEALLEEAERVSVPGSPKPPPPPSLGPSGASVRSLQELEDAFVTRVALGDRQVRIESSWRLLKLLHTAIKINRPILLNGPTGTGKSSSVKWLAALNGVAHLAVSMKPAIGREEMIGGLKPTPQGLAWQWGFLIKAIASGDWVTLEELNLAPSEVLEFLNEFLNSGFVRLTQYLDEETLKAVLPAELFESLKSSGFILKPHPRFRLFATMNPDFYSVRNKLAQTLLNRMVQVWVPDYTAKEMELILQAKYGFTPERSVQLVENLYQGLKLAVASGHLAKGYKDKYEFSLRTLLRIGELHRENLALYQAVKGPPDEKTQMLLLGRALWEVLGFMMRGKADRRQLWLLLDASLGLNRHGIKGEDLEPKVSSIRFDPEKKEVVFEKDLLPLRISLKAGGAFVPPESFNLPPTPQVLRTLYWLARRISKGESVLLVGETAAGKTSLIQYLHRILNKALYYTNLSSESAAEELEGGYQPDPARPGRFRFAPGLLEKAGKEYAGRGASLFVDEFNLSGLVEQLGGAQDEKALVTPEGVARLGPETVLIGAMNPPHYQSRNTLSPALRARHWEAWIEEPGKKEATLRLGWVLKKLFAMALLALGIGLFWAAPAFGQAGAVTAETSSVLPGLLAFAGLAAAVLEVGGVFERFQSQASFFPQKAKPVILRPDSRRMDRGTVKAADLRPDLGLVAVGYDAKTQHVFDTRAGRKVLELGPTVGSKAIAFSPDGKLVAVAGEDQVATIFDATNGRRLKRLKGKPETNLTSIAFSRDASRLATGGSYRRAAVWDIKDVRRARKVVEVQHPEVKGTQPWVRSVSFSSDDKRLLTAGGDGKAIVWDSRTGEKLLEIQAQGDGLTSAVFSPDDSRILTIGWDRTAGLWSARTGERLKPFKGYGKSVIAARFSPDGKRILTVGDDWVMLWDSRTGKRLGRWKTPLSVEKTFWGRSAGQALGGRIRQRGSPVAAALTPAGVTLVNEEGPTAVLWNLPDDTNKRMLRELEEGAKLEEPPKPGGGEEGLPAEERFRIRWAASVRGQPENVSFFKDDKPRVFQAPMKEVKALAFSPDGSLLAAAGKGRYTVLWDVRTGRKARRLHTADSRDVRFSPDGKTLAIADEFMLRLHAQETGEQPQIEGRFRSVDFSPDGKKIVTTDNESRAAVWDVATRQKLLEVTRPSGWLAPAQFGPYGNAILTAGGDQKAVLWHAETGEILREFEGHTDGLHTAVFHPDGSKVLTASYDKAAIIWDARTGGRLLRLKGHKGWVLSAAFSPDGRLAATGGSGPGAVLWDARTGEKLRELEGRQGEVHAVAFTPDGKRLATAGEKGRVLLWKLPDPGDLSKEEDLSRKAELPSGPEREDAPASAEERFRLRWKASLGEPQDPMDQFLSKNAVPEDLRTSVRRALEELWEVLTGIASALGGDRDVQFRVGHWWSMDPVTKTILIPIQEVLKHLGNLPALVGAVAHEAGHVFYTRLDKLPRYRQLLESTGRPAAVHNLFNVLEDMYQERAEAKRWPGVEFYLKALHQTYRPDLFSGDLALPEDLKEEEAQAAAVKELFPHEEFLDALRTYWITGKFTEPGSLVNPEVADAVEKASQPVAKLLQMLPSAHSPSEEERLRNNNERLKWTEREILPLYLELLKLSESRLDNALRKAAARKGPKPPTGEGKAPAPGASQIIQARAGKLRKLLCPTHGHSQPADPQSISLAPEGETRPKPSENPEPKPEEPKGKLPESLERVKRLLAQHAEVLKKVSPTNAYEKLLARVFHLIDAFAGRLENLFVKNSRVSWEGFFNKGQRPNVKRWIRSEARGWRNRDDFKVFERKRLPTRRDYKFTLLLDLSGSMDGEKKEDAMKTAALFLEVLERLGIDHSLLGFSTKVHFFKSFSEDSSLKALSPEEKNAILESIRGFEGGDTYDTEAVHTALKGYPSTGLEGLEDQPGERRILIVVTDGEGNGADSARMDGVLAEAARKGIEVIGIGIGDGMAYVQQRYPRHVLVPSMETLPEEIGDVLEEEIEAGFREGVADE